MTTKTKAKTKNKPLTTKDLEVLFKKFLKKLLTKADIKAFTNRLEKNVLKSVKEYADMIKKFYGILSRKINRLDVKISRNNLEIVKQQKFLLQKIKDHEKRIQELERDDWEN